MYSLFLWYQFRQLFEFLIIFVFNVESYEIITSRYKTVSLTHTLGLLMSCLLLKLKLMLEIILIWLWPMRFLNSNLNILRLSNEKIIIENQLNLENTFWIIRSKGLGIRYIYFGNLYSNKDVCHINKSISLEK